MIERAVLDLKLSPMKAKSHVRVSLTYGCSSHREAEHWVYGLKALLLFALNDAVGRSEPGGKHYRSDCMLSLYGAADFLIDAAVTRLELRHLIDEQRLLDVCDAAIAQYCQDHPLSMAVGPRGSNKALRRRMAVVQGQHATVPVIHELVPVENNVVRIIPT